MSKPPQSKIKGGKVWVRVQKGESGLSVLIKGNIIVCDREDGKRWFTYFDTYEQLWEYICAQRNPDMYEIVLRDQAQKPRFDIDIPHEYASHFEQFDSLITEIVNSSQKVCKELKMGAVIYTSHGPSKRSGHIVLTKLKHLNNSEAKQFYLNVLEGVRAEWRQFVDHAVYGSRQNFRMLSCSKEGHARPKIKVGVATVDIEDFRESMLGCVDGCVHVPVAVPVEKKHEKQDLPGSLARPASLGAAQDVDEIMQALKTAVQKEDIPFEVRDVQPGRIILNRTRSAMCGICKRSHDNDNAYITIADDGSLWFHCYRMPGKKNGQLFARRKPIIPAPAPMPAGIPSLEDFIKQNTQATITRDDILLGRI